MPRDAPGKLSRQEVADIISYILQVNKFPAGEAELGTDDEAYVNITIEQ